MLFQRSLSERECKRLWDLNTVPWFQLFVSLSIKLLASDFSFFSSMATLSSIHYLKELSKNKITRITPNRWKKFAMSVKKKFQVNNIIFFYSFRMRDIMALLNFLSFVALSTCFISCGPSLPLLSYPNTQTCCILHYCCLHYILWMLNPVHLSSVCVSGSIPRRADRNGLMQAGEMLPLLWNLNSFLSYHLN